MEFPGPSKKPVKGDESPSEILSRNEILILRSPNDIYKVIEVVGSGTFGKVYRAYAEISHIDVAIKFFNTWRKNLPKKEFETCRLFDGSNHFVHAVEMNEYNGRPFLVFEFLPETLKYHITMTGPFPIKLIRTLIRQLLQALKDLKDKQIVHCDLKPSNIMVEYWNKPYINLKIIDFGGAIKISECNTSKIVQTKPYRAPEVIIGAPLDEKLDMWAIGCVLAEMLAARCLYPGTNDMDVIRMVVRCQGPIPPDVLARGYNTCDMFDLVAGADDSPVFQMIGGVAETSSYQGYYDFQTHSLDELVEFDPKASVQEKFLLLNLLKSMLQLDSELRCTPEEALEHDFFKTVEDLARRVGKLSLGAARSKK